MLVKTNLGKTFEGQVFMAGVFRGKPRLIVEVNDMTMAKAAEALDGAAWIRVEKNAESGVSTTYEGYSKITMLSRANNGSVRVTLEGAVSDE